MGVLIEGQVRPGLAGLCVAWEELFYWARGRVAFRSHQRTVPSRPPASAPLPPHTTRCLTICHLLPPLASPQSGETLPEQLLGTMRLDKLDLKSAAYLDEGTGRVMRASDM